MLTNTKTFDCVEMKRQAQEKLQAEYESQKGEYSSYFAFLEARARRSEWQRQFWAKIADSQLNAGK